MINLWRPIPALIPQANSRFSRKVAIGATIIFKWRAWLFVRANAEARKEPFIIYFFWGVILAEWIRPRSPSVFYQILYSTPSQVLRPFFSKKRKRERGKKSVGRCKKSRAKYHYGKSHAKRSFTLFTTVLHVKIPDRGPHIVFFVLFFQFSSFAIMSPYIWLGNSRGCMRRSTQPPNAMGKERGAKSWHPTLAPIDRAATISALILSLSFDCLSLVFHFLFPAHPKPKTSCQ